MEKTRDKFKVGPLTFSRIKFTGVDGRPAVDYVQDSNAVATFVVQVRMSGLRYIGTMDKEIYSEADVQDWAEFLSECVKDLRNLRPRIETSFSGH